MRKFKSKKHNTISEYIKEVRCDRLDEWQMDELADNVEFLEKSMEEVLFYLSCINNDVFIDKEEVSEIIKKYNFKNNQL